MTLSFDQRAVRRASLRFSLIYWGGAFLASVIFWLLKSMSTADVSQHVAYISGKFLRYGSGLLLTAAISYLLFCLHRWASRRGPSEGALPLFVLASFLISLAASPLWAAFGYAAQALFPLPQMPAYDWNTAINDTALGAALFFGWSCLFVSLIFSLELHERANRLAAAREEALTAQMRALRYQVNPHFLFNTLNSIAGLIEEGSATRAERMVLSLSTFLRTTLSLDPIHDVPLAEELALQEEYLAIEHERFSDRMAFALDVSEEAKQALVPSLILQPLIENAIKHGVGVSTERVDILLRARRTGNRLHITLDNTLPAANPGTRRAGMGVGLRNVTERLQARFQDDAAFSAGVVAPGRYRAVIDLPFRLAAGAQAAAAGAARGPDFP